MSAKKQMLLDTIKTVESDGNYNVMVGGKRVPLTDMTVGQVLEHQRGLKGNTAAGAYQIKLDTLMSLVYKPGKNEGEFSNQLRNPTDFNLDTKFDEVAQDWAASALMDRRGYEDYQNGAISTKEMVQNLSKEWASIPDPAKGERQSHYSGDGMHDKQTRVSTGEMFNVLEVVEARPSRPTN
jgi:muramidase (phage lysozyme)